MLKRPATHTVIIGSVLVVIVAVPFLIRMFNGAGAPTIANQPHLDSSSAAHSWFNSPDTGQAFTVESDRQKKIRETVATAKAAWIGAGLSDNASLQASHTLERVLQFAILSDVDALFESWKVSSLSPSKVALVRVDWYGKHQYGEDAQKLKMWDNWNYETKILDAIQNNPRFSIPINSVGSRVLAGVGFDYLQIITAGFHSFEVMGSHFPQPRRVGEKLLYSSDRSASCAIPVTVEGLGDVWLEFVLKENANDAYWHVSQTVLWIPPGITRKADQMYLWAL